MSTLQALLIAMVLIFMSGCDTNEFKRETQQQSANETGSNAIEVFDQAVSLLRDQHAMPYRVVGKKIFDQRVDEVRKSLKPDASDAALAIAIMRVNTLIGDSHTQLYCGGQSPTDLLYPAIFVADGSVFRLWSVFELDKTNYDEDLLAAEILAIQGIPWKEARERLLSFCPGDNEFGGDIHASIWLRCAKIAREVGLADRELKMKLKLKTLSGKMVELVFEPRKASEIEEQAVAHKWTSAKIPTGPDAILRCRDSRDPHWLVTLKEHNAVYAQYNQCNTGKPTTESFAEEIVEAIESSGADRLIVDVRRNPGGLNYRNKPILHAIFKCDAVNRPGGLFVLIGPNTFSATMNFCGWLERETHAIFVGDPSGAGVNMCGDTHGPHDLDRPGWQMFVSKLYWQEGMPEDRRQWIHPYVVAPTTLIDLMNGRDPGLDAALQFNDDKLIAWLKATEPRRQWTGPSQLPAIEARKTWPRR